MGGDTDAANERARRLYRSPGFRGAYVNGARAALAGHGKRVCPYGPDSPSWRHTYRLAWLRGWYSVAGPTGGGVGGEDE